MTFFRELVVRLRSKRGRTETASVSLCDVIEEAIKDPVVREAYEAEIARMVEEDPRFREW